MVSLAPSGTGHTWMVRCAQLLPALASTWIMSTAQLGSACLRMVSQIQPGTAPTRTARTALCGAAHGYRIVGSALLPDVTAQSWMARPTEPVHTRMEGSPMPASVWYCWPLDGETTPPWHCSHLDGLYCPVWYCTHGSGGWELPCYSTLLLTHGWLDTLHLPTPGWRDLLCLLLVWY